MEHAIMKTADSIHVVKPMVMSIEDKVVTEMVTEVATEVATEETTEEIEMKKNDFNHLYD